MNDEDTTNEPTEQGETESPGGESASDPVTTAAEATSEVDFGELKSEEKTMALLCHLLGIFTSFVGPLILWLIKKDDSRFVDDQGKEALNFQITLIIAYVIGAATFVICIGAIITLAAWLGAIIFGILGAVEANKGNAYRYPFALRLIK